MLKGRKPSGFHGFTADLESVAEIIRQWVSDQDRWLSPKFLIGESYGTTRAAGLAQLLQDDGMYLNGLMLNGATPFTAAEDSLAHLAIARERHDDIEHHYYPAGHMMHVHEPSRVQQSADLRDFVRRRSGGPA